MDKVFDCIFVARRTALVALLIGLLIVGCGGSGGGEVQTAPISLAINWPDRGRTVSAPSSALSGKITIRAAAPNRADIEFVADRSADETGHLETYVSNQPGVPGMRMVDVRFFSGRNATGSIVGEASFETSIAADGKIHTIVTVDSKIASVEVAAGQHVWARQLRTLVATAYDAQRNVLVLEPDALKWAVTAGADRLRIADGQAEGVLMGTAQVTASVDGKTSPSTDVEVRATAERIVLPGTTPTSPYPYYYSRLSKDGSTVAALGIDEQSESVVAARWTPANGLQLLSGYPKDPRLGSDASIISADGSVIAGHRKYAGGVLEGWIWRNGEISTFTPTVAGANVRPSGCSADGMQFCGYQETEAGWRAFRSGASGVVTLLEQHAQVTESQAIRMSDDGTRIVGSQKIGGIWRATLWINGSPQLLSPESNIASRALCISGDGQVVFGAFEEGINYDGFRWTSMDGVQMIGEVIPRDCDQTGAVAVASAFQGPAYVWSTARGLEAFNTYIGRETGLVVSQDNVRDPMYISSDGKTISGQAGNSWMVRPVATD